MNMTDMVRKFSVGQEGLRKLVDEQKACVESVLEGHPNGFSPVLVVMAYDVKEGDEVQMHVFALMDSFSTPEDKHGVLAGVGRAIARKELLPAAVILASEAWTVYRSADWLRKNAGRPADQPDRQEVVVLQGLALDRSVCLSCLPITREGELIYHKGEWQDKDPDGEQKCTANLLNSFYKGFFTAALGMMF